jgi:hypothetical protein
MNDHELLERVAAGAPVPGPGYATDMLARARRAHSRRRRAGMGGALGAVAAAVVGFAAVAPSAQTAAPPPPPPGTATHTPAGQSAPAEAGPYATAIQALADEVRISREPWPVLYILDHTCANVATPTRGECDPQPLPAPLRDAITSALAGYAPVTFVADSDKITGPDLVIANGGALVKLGRIRLGGDRAEVPLSVQQSGLNGRGLTYQLSRDGQRWWIEGTVGPQWIN